MKWPRRRRRPRDLTRRELLDGLGRLAGQLRVEHSHTVRQEPLPAPESASVVVLAMDGDRRWTGQVNVGRGAYTRLQLPLSALVREAGRGEFFELEFRWYRP